MQPTLVEGDVAILETRKARVGDVVVFKAGDRLVAHRLVARLPGPFRRWGLQVGDGHQLGGWIDLNRVVGVVVDPDVYEEIPPAAQAAEILCHAVWGAASRLARLVRRARAARRSGTEEFRLSAE